MKLVGENEATFDYEPESIGRCEVCGEVAELRPYGPRGQRICHPCGMKDPDGTIARCIAYVRALIYERN